MPKREFLKTMEDGLRYNPLFAPFSMFEYNLDLVVNGSWEERLSKGWSTILGMITLVASLFWEYGDIYSTISELLWFFFYTFLGTYILIVVFSLFFKRGWLLFEHPIKFMSGIQFSLVLLTALIVLGMIELYANRIDRSGR